MASDLAAARLPQDAPVPLLSHLPSPGPDTSDGEDNTHHTAHPSSSATDNKEGITISSASVHAEQAVAPFLAKHIPSQYNPIGHAAVGAEEESKSSTKFCYRHHPDLRCRRQANEPSMDQLQNELGQLSQSDQQAISHVWSLFSAAPAKHRNLMLQGILTQCCFPQLSFISASVRDLVKIDFLSALPAELGFKILCYLDTISLCKATQVSRRWRSLADDDVVWHRMCEQHIDRKCTKCGWGLPLLERKRLRKEKRQIELRAHGNRITQTATDDSSTAVAGIKRKADSDDIDSAEHKKVCEGEKADSQEVVPSQPRLRPWKDVYKDRFKVGTNWKHGRCTLKTFKGHTNGVMCLQFDDTILATGSYDATIKIWDIETGEVLRTLSGHTSGIRCLQFDDSKLVSGSLDKTIKIWNWRTGECLRTFGNAHTDGVIALHFDSNFMASGSMDHTIRVWDLQSKTKYTFCLRGHTDWVNSVKIDSASRTLLSASDDCTVRLWDLDTKRCIRVFEGHVGQVQQVMFLPHEFEVDEADLLNGSNDDDASSTGSRSPTMTRAVLPHSHSYHGHQRITPPSSGDLKAQTFWPDDASRPAPPRYMFTGALDSTIRLWDIHAPVATPNPRSCQPPSSTSCLRTFFGHVEGIWSLAADHLRLVSGSEDRMVKIWDPRSGKCERTWTGHAGPVTCVGLSDSRLVSGSEDCEVRMLVFGDADGNQP